MERITHDVEQGSDEWLALKRKFPMSASMSAAAMDLSPYLSRSELIHGLATGEWKEHSDFVEDVIFKRGHKVEEAVRLQIESRLCQDLYPVVMTYGGYLASCDGLTFDKKTAFECKQYNKNLFASIKNDEVLPEHHMPQAQHVMMVTGAGELIFACGNGKDNPAALTVTSCPKYQQRIKDAWDQVYKEVAEYEAPVKPVEVVTANVDGFSLVVQADVTGQVTASNVKEMEATAIDFFGNLDRTLETDEQFAYGEKIVKFAKKVEEAMKTSEAGIMAQTHSVAELLESLRNISSLARDARLYFDKEIKAKKVSIKYELVRDAMGNLESHVSKLEASILPVTLSRDNNFHVVTKGLKTIASIQNALNSHLAELIIKSNAEHASIEENVKWFDEFTEGWKTSLFHDIGQIAKHDHEAFKGICISRKAEHDAQVSAEADRIAEVKAKEMERKIAVAEIERHESGAVAKVESVGTVEPNFPDYTIKNPVPMSAMPDRAPEESRVVTELYGELISHCEQGMSVPSAISKIADLIVKGKIANVCLKA
jgi:predicted phage-related endonuclease